MKFYFPFLCLIFSFSACMDTQVSPNGPMNHKIQTSVADIGFDEALANQFGADEYGMKKYVIALLKKGPNRDIDSIQAQKLQMAHLKNIERLAKEKKLVLAGPFFGNDELRGIYIFDVNNIQEAQELINTDPAIVSGSLNMELKEWYGSAALLAINEIHNRIQKRSVSENKEK